MVGAETPYLPNVFVESDKYYLLLSLNVMWCLILIQAHVYVYHVHKIKIKVHLIH